MKKISCLAFGLLICFFSAHSQQEDFAVSIKGDTIRGKMSIIDSPLSGHSLVVKVDKKKVSYPSFRLSELNKEGEVYHVRKIEGRYQFVKLVHQGFLSLYKYSPNDQQSAQLFQGSILIRKDGKSQPVPNLGFKKQMSTFLDDCESLSENILTGGYSKKDLIKIIDEYNACIPEGYSPEPGDIVEEIVYTPDTSKIDELINKVKSDTSLSGNTELQDMLIDVKTRYTAGNEIPSYLSSIIKSNLNGKDYLLKLLDEILED
jgi:hypothetical protein